MEKYDYGPKAYSYTASIVSYLAGVGIGISKYEILNVVLLMIVPFTITTISFKFRNKYYD